jgi:conserved oligomeric Golgi complex subunit 3
MIKNLLILKNQLISLEIGDIRSQGGGMQHFPQIWDALSAAGGWVGYFSSFIPGSSLWSRGASPAASAAKAPGAATADQDASEQLDELLRQSIYSFTQRWGAQLADSSGAGPRKTGGKNVAKLERELDEMLGRAFGDQPEVVAKLKEAIQINARAHGEQKGGKTSRV